MDKKIHENYILTKTNTLSCSEWTQELYQIMICNIIFIYIYNYIYINILFGYYVIYITSCYPLRGKYKMNLSFYRRILGVPYSSGLATK